MNLREALNHVACFKGPNTVLVCRYGGTEWTTEELQNEMDWKGDDGREYVVTDAGIHAYSTTGEPESIPEYAFGVAVNADDREAKS